MFKNRRASRIIFVEYLFSNIFSNNSLKEIINILKNEEEEDIIYNEDFLKELYNNFNKNKDQILDLINIYNNRQENIDKIVVAILQAAVSEMFINQAKVVISEYLKIADLLDVNSAFINGVLNSVAKDKIIKDFNFIDKKNKEDNNNVKGNYNKNNENCDKNKKDDNLNDYLETNQNIQNIDKDIKKDKTTKINKKKSNTEDLIDNLEIQKTSKKINKKSKTLELSDNLE